MNTVNNLWLMICTEVSKTKKQNLRRRSIILKSNHITFSKVNMLFLSFFLRCLYGLLNLGDQTSGPQIGHWADPHYNLKIKLFVHSRLPSLPHCRAVIKSSYPGVCTLVSHQSASLRWQLSLWCQPRHVASTYRKSASQFTSKVVIQVSSWASETM